MIPFLGPPIARSLAWLRNRPGAAGPRAAGLGVGLILPALIFFPVAAVVYPHLPPELDNGFKQLLLPLLRRGLAQDNLGARFLGQSPILGLIPYALAIASAILFVALLLPGRASFRGRLQAAGIAASVGALILGANFLRGSDAASKRDTLDFVIELYDPRPSPQLPAAASAKPSRQKAPAPLSD